MKRRVSINRNASMSTSNNAYQDMMGAPQDVAQHPTRNLPAPQAGDFRGSISPLSSVQEPFADKSDPFNIGA